MKPVHPQLGYSARRAMMLVYFACIACGLVGCSQPPLSKSEAPAVADRAESIRDKAKDQLERAEKIDRQADVAAKVPGAEQPAAAIKAENQGIKDDAHAIHATATEIRDSQAKIDALVKERDQAIGRAEKAESEAGKAERRIWVGVRLIAGVSGLVAVGLVLWGNGWAALFAVVSACVFFGSFAVSMSLDNQTIIGGICLAGVAVAAVIAVRSRLKSAREIAETFNTTVRDRKMPKNIAKVANAIQSKTTKRLVDATQRNGLFVKARRFLANILTPDQPAGKVAKA